MALRLSWAIADWTYIWYVFDHPQSSQSSQLSTQIHSGFWCFKSILNQLSKRISVTHENETYFYALYWMYIIQTPIVKMHLTFSGSVRLKWIYLFSASLICSTKYWWFNSVFVFVFTMKSNTFFSFFSHQLFIYIPVLSSLHLMSVKMYGCIVTHISRLLNSKLSSKWEMIHVMAFISHRRVSCLHCTKIHFLQWFTPNNRIEHENIKSHRQSIINNNSTLAPMTQFLFPNRKRNLQIHTVFHRLLCQ